MTLIERLRARRAELFEQVDAITQAADAEDRDVTDEELGQVRGLREQIDAVEERMSEESAEEERRSRARDADLSDSRGRETATPGRAPAVVTSEPRTYTREAERREGRSFVRDFIRATFDSDFDARDRLARHMREARVEGEAEGIERRDVGTGAFAGLTVPQYLVDLVAPLARAARPFADICRSLTLPSDGMTVNISRITTGTAVAAQATENTGVQETDADDTLLTVNVRTIAGMQDVSRQAIDRSTGADEIIVADLVAAYNAELDRQCIHSDGTGGTHVGLVNVSGNVDVTYDDASPTAAELYPKLADAIQQVQSNVYMGVTHFLMHPRRWWWVASQVGSTFPFLQIPGAPQGAAGQVGGTAYGEAGRQILGVPVVLDGNIATNLGAGAEDAIFAVTAPECFLWETPGSPLLIRADQPLANQLSVRLVVYAYSAFTAGRYPKANAHVAGTGLTTPTF